MESWKIRKGSEKGVDSPSSPAHTLFDDINKIVVKWQLRMGHNPLNVDRIRVTTKYMESHHIT